MFRVSSKVTRSFISAAKLTQHSVSYCATFSLPKVHASIYQQPSLIFRSVRQFSTIKTPPKAKNIPQLDEYVGETNEDGKRHGFGKFHWKTKDGVENFYEGEWKNGIIEGNGTLYINGYQLYKGGFERNRFHGNGFIYLENGTYEGHFINSLFHGTGTLRYHCGDVYSGEFMTGKKGGKGVYKFANGDVYEGLVVEDHVHGRGVMKSANGDVYDGEFVQGVKDGRGVYESVESGERYTGEFESDCYHGIGQLELTNLGESYNGEFVEGLKQGVGLYTYNDGSTYSGMWHGDVWHGLGELKKPPKTQAETAEVSSDNTNSTTEQSKTENKAVDMPVANNSVESPTTATTAATTTGTAKTGKASNTDSETIKAETKKDKAPAGYSKYKIDLSSVTKSSKYKPQMMTMESLAGPSAESPMIKAGHMMKAADKKEQEAVGKPAPEPTPLEKIVARNQEEQVNSAAFYNTVTVDEEGYQTFKGYWKEGVFCETETEINEIKDFIQASRGKFKSTDEPAEHDKVVTKNKA